MTERERCSVKGNAGRDDIVGGKREIARPLQRRETKGGARRMRRKMWSRRRRRMRMVSRIVRREVFSSRVDTRRAGLFRSIRSVAT